MSARRRRRLRILVYLLLGALVLALLLPMLSGVAQADSPPAGAPFRLVHVTDSHWIGGSANTGTKGVLADIAKLSPQATMVVHGGDITEVGAIREYDEWEAAYHSALPYIPAKYVPGNHDGRWLDAGLGQFSSRYGGGNSSFDGAGVHWVLLDSTIAAETHGHFGQETLDWLRQDLDKVGTEMPTVIFFHHPIAYTPLQFTDTDDELLTTVAPYNVRAIFTGHGHLHMRWQRNNVDLVMTQAALEGGYKVLDVVGGVLKVQDRTDGKTVAAYDIPLTRPQASGVAIQAITQQPGDGWQVTLKATNLPATAKIYYQIDEGNWYPAAPGPDGVAKGPFSMSGYAPGRHRLRLWAAMPGVAFPGQAMTAQQWIDRNLGPSWSDWRDVELAGGLAVAWRWQGGAGIQAPAEVGLGRAYVADRSGLVVALDLANGSEAWRLKAGAAIVGAPVLGGELLGVGTVGGEVLAISARTGQPLWRFQAQAPVLAAPLWAGGRMIISDAKGYVYGLDRNTGTLIWQYKVGAGVRAGAAYGAGSVFLGSWDGAVYALDVFTGALQWKKSLPGSIYYAPANQPPLYFRGRVFVTRSQPAGGQSLFALDARDGAVLWTAAGGFGYSAPVLHDGRVAVASGGGGVYGYDVVSGVRQYVASSGVETFDGAVSSVGTSLVLSALNGQVVSFAAAGGKAAVEWRFSTGAAYSYARPAAAAGLVLAGTMDGTLWALKTSAKPPAPLTLGTPGEDVPPVLGTGFPDLAGHPDAAWVTLGKQMGLTSGFPDGTFHPNETLTRAQQAVVLARYLGLSAPSKGFVSQFADIQGHWAAAYVAALEEKGLVSGVKNAAGQASYQPDRPVTRAEVAALQTRIMGRTVPSSGSASQFSDLAGHWSAPAVRRLEELGLVAGTVQADGRRVYGPDTPVVRAEAMALLVRGAIGR